jgi:predicted tellurium resistance membrane protein TerC
MTVSEALIIIASLIALEGLLSADNAMVLAVMVKPLPAGQRRKALLYGIVGAYVLRGLMLLSASVVIRLWWIQLAGGGYLIFLATRHVVHATRRRSGATAPAGSRRVGSGAPWPRWSSSISLSPSTPPW